MDERLSAMKDWLWQVDWPIFWDVLDKAGIAIGIFGLLVSLSIRLYLRRKERRDNDLIHIRLKVEEPAMLLTLNGQIRRKNLTRAEVLGLLGMLPMWETGKRYELAALNREVFFAELEEAQVQAGIDEVVIPCSAAEVMQFDEQRLADVCSIEEVGRNY